MKVIDLGNFDAAVTRAADEIRAGGAVIYPTDTVYALAVSAVSEAALDRADRAKGRAPAAKPLSLCVADLEQAAAFVEIDDRARTLADAFFPGALTMVCLSKNVLPARLQAGFPGVGIRVPGHPFGPALARALGHPITTTSANASGLPPAIDAASAQAAFAGSEFEPALLIDGGPAPIGMASTVIDLTGGEVKLLREGAIPFRAVLDALRGA
ncbi:L-threonylcarbamoyladenylate synthase [Terricaulis silvestris]|uniref:L-threonylcarbamoyladenylate synthase n=1 Tax=Terricaulis silvestris TaxID=2686094 RepID=A0A6I6MQV7_9CAUL|nr:L-threonylcarbamoyladenylate synthase [Terricaulis silvestris]QGZ93573.1 t(6)A37 threonylcarbamoyladenosine biosynthesis protein RimN [Terricaulis silvestris]